MIYIVIDKKYLHTYGLQRALRFARTYTNYIDAVKYLSAIIDPEFYEVITVKEEDLKKYEKG